jgi:hypothetical protein
MSTVTLDLNARARSGLSFAVFGVVSVFVAWPASGATFTDVPAKEIIVTAPLPPVPSQDAIGAAFGLPDGEISLLMLEDTRIKSRHSSDGGATWSSEVAVNGASTTVVQDVTGAFSADGKLYAAWLIPDPTGFIGMAFARSDDMGQHWTTPKVLLQSGNPSFGATKIHMATGGPGQAAIIYRGNGDSDPWVTATADSGTTWTTPVRIDAGVAIGSAPTNGERIAMDSSGRIFATFIQSRSGSGATVFYTRSTNGGATFAAEQTITLPAHANSDKPDIEVTTSGDVLIALWDSADSDHIYVERSTDQGQTYATVLNRTLANNDFTVIPTLYLDPGSGLGFVTWVRTTNEAVLVRTTDEGATWGSDFVAVSTAAGSIKQKRAFTPVVVTKTSAGHLVVAWSDQRADAYTGLEDDVYARASTDGGVTWGTEQRVDGGTAGTHQSWIDNIASYGSDNVFVFYQDDRDDNGRAYNFHANRSAAATLSFGADARVDQDDGTVTPSTLAQASLATDATSHVYYAFSAATTGPQTDILVAASADGGHTFGTPVRVGSTTAGTRVSLLPEIKAFSDGKVYLEWESDNPGVGREIRFSRSTDYGATWQATDTVLATLTHTAGYVESGAWPAVDLEATVAGSVYVAWSDNANVFLARSTDFGVTFSTADVDQDSRGNNRFPRICANGSLIILTWESPNVALTVMSLWATASVNNGVSWIASSEIRSDTAAGGVDRHALTCDTAGRAVVVWPDYRSGVDVELWSNRWNGGSWNGEIMDSAPTGMFLSSPHVQFVDAADDAVAVYEDQSSNVWATRSNDGAHTFTSWTSLDAAAPVPAAPSYSAQLTTDAAGHVWAAWLDESAGAAVPQLAVRHSGDGGATWGPVYRLDRKTPQGAYPDAPAFYGYTTSAAALPGAGMFSWGALRESWTRDPLFNAYDVNDFDRDGVPTGTDCNDADSTLKTIPPEVAGLVMSKVTGASRVAWTSEGATAGTATHYDTARGLLSALRSSGNFSGATCLADNVPDTPYDDTSASPPVGDGYWYLVRGQNACGTGTYGRSTLDVASPCP